MTHRVSEEEETRLHRKRQPGKQDGDSYEGTELVPDRGSLPDTQTEVGPAETKKYQTGQRRSRVQRERDLKVEAELYLKGWFQWQIAEHISLNRPYNITQGAISNDLRDLRQRWIDSALVSLDERQAEELARINQLERQYWEAWENSLRAEESELDETAERGDRHQIITRTSQGEPRYLQGIQWCIARRIEMFGLDAPKKLDVRRANVNVDLNLETMSSDELRDLERILSKAVSGPDPAGESPAEPDPVYDVDV
jgi:hypothetical protein